MGKSLTVSVPLAGIGKSMRAKRLKRLLCKGWVHEGAQQSTAKSGMNGGALTATQTLLDRTKDTSSPSPALQAWTSRAAGSLRTTR